MNPIICKKCGSCKGGEYEWGEKVDQAASEDCYGRDIFTKMATAFASHLERANVELSSYYLGHLAIIARDILLSERQKWEQTKRCDWSYKYGFEEGRKEALNGLLEKLPNEMSGCICSQSVCAPGKCKTVNGYNGTLSQIRQIIKDQLK